MSLSISSESNFRWPRRLRRDKEWKLMAGSGNMGLQLPLNQNSMIGMFWVNSSSRYVA